MITIVDYGMGNLGSVLNMFKKVGAQAKIVSDLEEIRSATKILLPGVGAFDSAMEKINSTGLREVLDHKALIEQIPVLGICLGMQLLTNGSEEGVIPGLKWINSRTVKFRFTTDENLKVPHMGWNEIRTMRKSPLMNGLEKGSSFYFVHSYYVKASESEDVLATTHHGIWFDSVINKGNIYGAQFHPEKSHKFGMKLMKNFAEI